MKIAGENGLEFLDLKLKIAEGKIRVDLYANQLIVLATLHLTLVTQNCQTIFAF